MNRGGLLVRMGVYARSREREKREREREKRFQLRSGNIASTTHGIVHYILPGIE